MLGEQTYKIEDFKNWLAEDESRKKNVSQSDWDFTFQSLKGPVWVEGKELTEFFQEIVNEAKRVGGAFPDANQLEVFLDWAKAMQAKEFSEIRAKIIQQEREIEMNCQHIESMLTREENSTIEKEEISEPTPLNPGSPIGEEENYETSPNPDGPEPTANSKYQFFTLFIILAIALACIVGFFFLYKRGNKKKKKNQVIYISNYTKKMLTFY